MRRHHIAARLGALIGALSIGVAPVHAVDYVAYEQITVGSSAIGFTTTLIVQGNGHPQANLATCRVETAQIRYRIDGTAPTSSVGTVLNDGDTFVLQGLDLLLRFQVIRTSSTSGALTCHYTS